MEVPILAGQTIQNISTFTAVLFLNVKCKSCWEKFQSIISYTVCVRSSSSLYLQQGILLFFSFWALQFLSHVLFSPEPS